MLLTCVHDSRKKCREIGKTSQLRYFLKAVQQPVGRYCHLTVICNKHVAKKKEIARAIYFKMKSKIFKSHKVVSNCDLLKVTKITNTNPQAQITLGPKRNTLNAKRKIRKDQTLVQGWYMD